MADSDPVYGAIKGRIPLYKNGLEQSGNLILYEDGFLLDNEGEKIKAPMRYIKMFENIGELPLGKVQVEMEVYDQTGSKFSMVVGMSDQHFLMLKKMLG